MKRNYILLIFILVNIVTKAQLSVQQLTSTAGIGPLLQNFLLGTGVQISNITYKGDLAASGSFGGTSNIGFSSGVLLTTGSITNAVGPNNSPNMGALRNSPGTDADLAKLIGVPVNKLLDEAILEFDFIATSDTVSFRYVFASEEYPEYVCGNQNDGFGFFITGVNPAGGTYNSQNLAIIPGTTSPVSISTVNPGVKGSSTTALENCPAGGLSHSNFYVSNSGASVQYDGFTVPLTATTRVKCGEKYHIKIAIADVSDASYDSGVFLEKGSFKTGGDGPKATTKIIGGVNDSTLMESCSGACVAFDRGKLNLAKEEKFKLTTSGTAQNGTDYNLLPAEITFPVGKDTVVVCLQALADGSVEGTETVIINLEKQSTGACDLTTATKVRLVIIDKPKLEITKSNDTIICKSAAVNLWADAKGGKSPYTYSWSNNGGNNAKTTVTPTKTTIYYVTVKDACGEEKKDSVKVTISDTIKVVVGGKDASCGMITGSVWLTSITGGTAPYTKSWSTIPAQTADTLKNLISGQYKLIVTDKNGCTNSATAEILNNKGMTGKVVDLHDPTCYAKCNGEATIEVKDGTAPYIYKWSDTTNTFDTLSNKRTNICMGDYNVTVTDKNGCTFIAQVTLKQPEQLKLNLSAFADSICFGAVDSLKAIATGGTPALSIVWNPGALPGAAVKVKPIGTTIYQATVTDKNGCTAAKDLKIAVSPEMKAKLNVSKLTCISNKDGLTAWGTTTGGFAPYKYSWPAPINKIGVDSVYNLKSGTYKVIATDNLGCTSKDSVIIVIPPPIKSVIARVTQTLCEKSCDGTAVVATTGGVPAYTIKWLTNPEQKSDTAKKLCMGTYKVAVTDKNGCADTAIAVINAPKPLKIDNITATPAIICVGTSTTLATNVTGGLPRYKYSWNPGKLVGQSITVTPDKDTEYTLVITDSNNCTVPSEKIKVKVSQHMSLGLKDLSYKCDSLGGKAVVTVKDGGIAPFKYVWNSTPAQQTDTLKDVGEGVYKITVTDTIGCKDSTTIKLIVSAKPKFNFAADSIKGCQPLLVNFKITASTVKSGGQYYWNFGDLYTSKQTNPSHTYYTPGCHDVSLTATNSIGCTHSDTVKCMIEVYPKPKAQFTYTPTVVMLLEPIVQFTDHSVNASILTWNFGDLSKESNESSPKHTYTIPGINKVMLTAVSDKGCVDIATAEIVVKEDVLVYIPSAFTPNNNGVNDVFRVYGNGIRSEGFQLYIYDRWGILLFKTNNQNEGWEGKLNNTGELLAEDVYVYIVNYLDEDLRKRTRTGNITLIK